MAGFTSVDDDPEHARDSARRAICSLYQPLPHPYYDFLLREQGFSAAADAATKLIPEGRLEAAVEAMDDDLVDSLCIAGTPAECRARTAEYEGVVDEMIYSNVAAVSSTLSHAGEVAARSSRTRGSWRWRDRAACRDRSMLIEQVAARAARCVGDPTPVTRAVNRRVEPPGTHRACRTSGCGQRSSVFQLAAGVAGVDM